MNTKEFLNNVCDNIKYKPASKQIAEELKIHIDEAKEENIYKGYSEKEAEELAVSQMGDAKEIGKKLNKIHRPKLDWITLILVIILIWLSGSYMGFLPSRFYSAFHEKNVLELNDIMTAKVEGTIFGLAVLFAIGLYFFDYRKISKHSKNLYIVATVLNVVAYFRGFRANGNLIYGLWPFTSVSPTIISIPLYIIAFAGFIKDIEIVNLNKRNIMKILSLSIISVITSLMINFVSGFIITVVYVTILSRELIRRKNIKYSAILITSSIIVFVLLSTIICIIPTKWSYKNEDLTSAYWVGIDTIGERRINTIRKEIFKEAKMFGSADLEEKSFQDEQSYIYSIQGYFDTAGNFALLGYLSNYGWIASIGFAVLIIIFDIKLIISVKKVKEQYGKIILIGFSTFFIVQTIGNIAMNFGIIGVAEFKMPFFASGEVGLLMNIICVSLMLSIYRRKDINFEEPQKSKILVKFENYFFEEC